MAELNARDAKLVQFLNEAHAKEAELEADLTAHISLTQKAPYKKRLQQHLKETKDHKRRTAQRIKQLGGQASSGLRAPGVPNAVGELAGKGVAAVKGQVGIARAALTEQAETHLRNAREELREEYVEIGTYTAIEAFANEVGDKDTAKLAREIRREEQKTADYLERLIPQLIKDIVKNEVPSDQRGQNGRRRSSSTRRSSSSSSRSSSSRSRGSSSSRGSSARKSARKSASGGRSSARRSAAGSRGGSSSNGGSGSGSSSSSSSQTTSSSSSN
jgi:ferritin-like metal-binding protein YciE